MSGGHWGYMQFKLRDLAGQQSTHALIYNALADAEKIIDWALCCDTSPEDNLADDGSVRYKGAKTMLYERMTDLFNELEGRLQ